MSKKKSFLYLAGVLMLFLFALSALFEVRADEDPANEFVGGGRFQLSRNLR